MICRLTALLIFAASLQAWAQVRIVAVVNSASLEPGLPSGGALATVLCAGLRADPGMYTASSPLPFRLDGIGIDVNGWPAPILAVFIPPRGDPAYAQINFQVPLERNATLRAGGADVGGSITVTDNGTDLVSSTSVPGGGFGGFFKDPDGFVLAKHASDDSPVTLDNPAHPGETIVVYANDFFAVWPPPPMALSVPEEPVFQYRMPMIYEYLYLQDYPQPVDAPALPKGSFTKTPAVQITFRGLAPKMIGVEEIRFVVPENQQPGDWALFFNRGSCPDRGGPCADTGRSSPYAKLPVR
jgi:uncharacterized protein (TIGR03437 family)